MSKRKSVRELDLHGIYHSDVFDIVDDFVGKCIIEDIDHFEIVTGYSERMKELVQEVLSDYKLKGFCTPYNRGKLVIKYENKNRNSR